MWLSQKKLLHTMGTIPHAGSGFSDWQGTGISIGSSQPRARLRAQDWRERKRMIIPLWLHLSLLVGSAAAGFVLTALVDLYLAEMLPEDLDWWLNLRQ